MLPRFSQHGALLAQLLVCCGSPTAKPVVPIGKSVSDLALDPTIVTGKLGNGLTYYIKQNDRPKQRVLLWLAVDVGSTLEDDDQLGLAHFVEHMAFNGTKRFEKKQITSFLERAGMQFGPHLNATTTFDDTTYQLQVPTDNPDNIDTALDILEDWATGITFDPEEVEAERGVVLEEWRRNRNADTRSLDRHVPVLFRGSRYANRIPIGKPATIQNVSADALRRFYTDWYRPELFAIVIVGDIDPQAIKTKLEKRFGVLTNPKTPRTKPELSVPPHAETLVSIVTDKEIAAAGVLIAHKRAMRPDRSKADIRRWLAEQMYHFLLSNRLQEIAQRPNPPFINAASGQENIVRSSDIILQVVQPRAGDVAKGIDAFLREARRVELHGFTEEELKRAKGAIESLAERAAAEAAYRHSIEIVREILRHHRRGEAMMGETAELALLKELLPKITATEVRDVFKDTLGVNRVVLITAPEGETVPNRDELIGMFDQISTLDLPAWKDSFVVEPLMTTLPKPGSKVATREISEVGVTEWTLSNGARVLFKPTDFAKDAILLKALGRGGSSLSTDDDYWSARFSAVLATLGGFGSLNFVDLQKRLAGSTAGLSVNVEELNQSVDASASSKDLEEMFQLFHLAFTAPRKDPASFASWKTRSTDAVKNRLANPTVEFNDAFNDAMSAGHLRRKPLSPERIAKLDLDVGIQFYRRLFGHANGFTFVIVGSFDIAKIEPLVLRYIGSLPAGKAESWRDVGVKRPKGVKKVTVKKGIEPKAQVRLAFHGPAKWSLRASHNLESLADALTLVLREQLREKLGGTYDISVTQTFNHFPKDRYLLEIAFDCDPNKADALIKATLAQLKVIRRKGIDADILTKIKQAQRRARETTLRSNRYWLNQLAAYAYYGLDPARVRDYDKFIQELDIKSIAKAANKYLNTRRYVRGVLTPE